MRLSVSKMTLSHSDDDETYPHFEGVYWRPLNIQADGSCEPPPKTRNTDQLWVKMAYHIGANVYNVVNLTKGYQVFVQLKFFPSEGYIRGPHGRCNHPDCVKWQNTQYNQKVPCKHIRSACKWHVKLTRRVRRLASGQS